MTNLPLMGNIGYCPYAQEAEIRHQHPQRGVGGVGMRSWGEVFPLEEAEQHPHLGLKFPQVGEFHPFYS